MKPTGTYKYDVLIWLKNWGMVSQKTTAADAVTAISNVVEPLKAKYGDAELIVIEVKRGSWERG